MHSRSIQSDFLLSQPSFISGMCRMLDLCGTYDGYHMSLTGREADYKALLSDWYTVGQDIADSMSMYTSCVPVQPTEHDSLCVTR